MKFNKSHLSDNEIKTIDEIVAFNEVRKPLLALKNIHVIADIIKDKQLINVRLSIKGVAQVSCAYTLEAVDYKLDFVESIDISENPNDIDTYFVKSNIIDLNPIILDLIVGEIPTKVIKKGAKLTQKGDGYRVISESDLRKEKSTSYNPKFDKLKDIDV